MVISSVTGMNNPIPSIDIPKIESSAGTRIVKKIETKDVENIMSTERYIRDYFKDIPIMIQIARCESTFRHLDESGEVHRGEVNDADVGVMQINEFYHLEKASKNDFDIYTIEGNTAYARDLFEREGTKPWNSSKPCWGKYQVDITNQIALSK